MAILVTFTVKIHFHSLLRVSNQLQSNNPKYSTGIYLFKQDNIPKAYKIYSLYLKNIII